MLKGMNEGHFTQFMRPGDSVMSFYANLQGNNLWEFQQMHFVFNVYVIPHIY